MCESFMPWTFTFQNWSFFQRLIGMTVRTALQTKNLAVKSFVLIRGRRIFFDVTIVEGLALKRKMKGSFVSLWGWSKWRELSRYILTYNWGINLDADKFWYVKLNFENCRLAALILKIIQYDNGNFISLDCDFIALRELCLLWCDRFDTFRCYFAIHSNPFLLSPGKDFKL